MKAFAIFPTVCFFVSTFTVLKLIGHFKSTTTLLGSIIVGVIFGALMILFSVQAFAFLFWANYVSVPILIVCLTFLGSKSLVKTSDGKKWVKIIGLALASFAVTLGLFSIAMFFALTNNSMGPRP